MKPNAYLIAFLLISCQQESKFVRVDNSEIDQDRLAFATDITKKILAAQKSGGYYALTEEEATAKMVEFLDESLQVKSYQQIKSAFGEYQDINFEYMMKPKDGSLFEIYRFKGQFHPDAEVEVRTVLDAYGKLTGLFVTSWKDRI